MSSWRFLQCWLLEISKVLSGLVLLPAAYYSDICVGSIACRLEKKEDGAVCVYIMTLGVLAPYRGLGIGKWSTYLQGEY